MGVPLSVVRVASLVIESFPISWLVECQPQPHASSSRSATMRLESATSLRYAIASLGLWPHCCDFFSLTLKVSPLIPDLFQADPARPFSVVAINC